MKRFYFLSVATLVAGVVGLFGLDASADNHHRVTNSGNTKATGGNGGKAQGKNAQGGAGGAANAKGGSIQTDKKGTTINNSGNTEAKGGDGGNAKGDGAKGGAGGAATAQGGDIGTPPKKIDPKKNPVDPGFPKGGNVKNDPKAGGGTGGTAKAGDTTATGGKGGDGQGKGAQGGAGGAATAINGDNNTVINGNVTINNNITYTPGKGGKGKGKGGMGGGILSSLLGNLGGGQGGGSGGGSSGGDSSGGGFAQGNSTSDATSQGAPGTSIASAPGETVITNDGSPAIAQGANGKDNVENAEADQIFTRRYLKVKNDSGVPMKVYVQYRGQDDKKWAWFPADPSESKNAIVHELTPGQEMFVQDKGNKLSASRVRIWGVADSQTWFDFRDEDLWVVPEMDQNGVHRYQASEMRTFTFIFPKQEKAASN